MATMRVTFRASPGGQNLDEGALRRVVAGPGVRRDLDRRATRVAAYVRIRIPMRTGRLRSSVRTDSGVGAAGAPWVAVMVGRGVPYASYYLFGTRPHVITPRRKKMLRFVQGGQVQFRRRVMHPGNAPNPVLNEAVRFWRD